MSEIKALNLEGLIKQVNYNKLLTSYFPSEFAYEFVNFIKLVNGEEGEENKSPLIHYKMADAIVENKNNLFVSFRGSAKSTLMEYLVLYLAVFGKLPNFGKVNLGLYVSDTMDNGAKNFRNNIEYRWENSEFLQKVTNKDKTKFTDSRITFVNKSGHKLIFKLYGATTGVRGAREMNKRPQIAILDDLLSDKNANSPAIIKTISNVVYNAVEAALHPTKKKMIWIGTPFNKKDPLYQAAGSSSWSTQVFPIAQAFPCTKGEFIGGWEDRFSYKQVSETYQFLKGIGRVDAFNQEYMLRIVSDDDRLVLDQDIVWYQRSTVLANKKDYNWYITTDFATSENQRADFSVISVWALDYKGIFYWVDGIVTRQDMSKNIDDLFRFVVLYAPFETGVEVSGQQKGFVSWIKSEMVSRNIFFVLANDRNTKEEGLRPNTNKLVRFNTVLPLFKQRKIMLPEELKESAAMYEALDELENVTSSGFNSVHDDFSDTISQLSLLNYFKPSNPETRNEDEVKEPTIRSRYFRTSVVEEDNVSSYIV